MPIAKPLNNFIKHSSAITIPKNFIKYQYFNKQQSRIMSSQSNSSNVEHTSNSAHRCGYVCSIIPAHVLTDILKHDGHSEATRAAVNNTLKTLFKLQETRKARQSNENTLMGSLDAEAPRTTSKAVYRAIYNSSKTNKKRKTLLFEEGGSTAAFSADVNAKEVYDFFGKSHDFYSEVFGRNSIDDNGLHLIGSIHYDDIPGPPGMDNAFWDGDEMAFGDGDGEIFGSFTKNIDVIGHELTHGVIQHEANLEYENQSGALNESLADVFGTMIKQYYHPDGKQLATDADWLIGEGIFLPTLDNAVALRSMKAPGTAYNNPRIGKDRQPADMDGFKKLPNTSSGDWGGVHTNSGIPNRAFYLVATGLGGYSWEKAGPIWYAALRDPGLKGIDTKAAFKIFADLTTKYALDLFDADAQAVVKDAWTKVKVYKTAAVDDVSISRAYL